MQVTRARVVVVDDWQGRAFPFECDPEPGKTQGEVVSPDIDENMVCSFDLPIATARRLVGKHHDRYRLYQCPPIQCRVDVGFSTKFVGRNPWYYEFDDEGKLVWKEQKSPPWDYAPACEAAATAEENANGSGHEERELSRRERAREFVTQAAIDAEKAMGKDLADQIVKQELAKIRKSDLAYLRMKEAYIVAGSIRKRTAGYLYQSQQKAKAAAPTPAVVPSAAPAEGGGILAGIPLSKE
jgi:hypothetical protein